MSGLYSFKMDITEETEMTAHVRKLWDEFFPHKSTPASDIPRTVVNRDWVRDSLLYYGAVPNKYNELNVTIKYIDGGAVLYSHGKLCGLITIKNDAILITYVDNRA